jgi:NAD(P)-dependent dehydrogenase (short-subunit alcohol dehydrogenase family)
VVIVTGGAGDIGRAIFATCAERGVIAIPADLDHGVRLDVRSAESWPSAIEAVVGEHSRLDGLVNAAGIVRDGPFTGISEEDWKQAIDVNLTGALLGCRAASPPLRREGRRIVNISSASWLGNVGQSAYPRSSDRRGSSPGRDDRERPSHGLPHSTRDLVQIRDRRLTSASPPLTARPE